MFDPHRGRLVLLNCWVAALVGTPAAATEPAAFPPAVRELLAHRCGSCHGAGAVESGFDLATRETLLAGGTRGPAVVPGDAGASLLYRLAARMEEPHMPAEGDPLTADELAALAAWIDAGAGYDRPLFLPADTVAWTDRVIADEARDFWSLAPLREVAVPGVADPAAWCRTPVDRFLLQRLHTEGLVPAAVAAPHTLVRRLVLDLTGIPPAPADVDAYAADPTPAAWERLVDDVLARPAYGERQTQHWLDVARFAESFGYEQDYDRPHAYHYRDFCIRAFNDDLPYDRFLQWQIAGDELAPERLEARKATGFLAAGAFPTQLTEKEFESARAAELDDMVATLGTAMLATTIGCARCHDHKFDPIPQADYYRLVAAFTATIRSNVQFPVDPSDPSATTVTLMVAGENLPKIPHHADDRGYPHFYPETHFLRRGDVALKDGVATPAPPQALVRPAVVRDHWHLPAPEGATSSHRRAAVARWLTDVDHGAGSLAARVIVNRLWQQHFGTGIVATPSDFGRQGEPPTHPELLEFLATELVRGGWRLKPIQRLIVTSAAYRQSATATTPGDPRLLPSFPRRRLDGEAIRDTLLALSGSLDQTLYGRAGQDESGPRRSLYLELKRSRLPPFIRGFDAPDRVSGVGRRVSTTTAPQVLAIMNNPMVRTWAERFAARITAALPTEAPPAAFVAEVYRHAVGRLPSSAEAEDAAAFLAAQQASYTAAGTADAAARSRTDFCQVIMGLNETLYVE